MKQTLTNINSGAILQCLRKASPITAQGKAAVENFKAWLVTNTMSAIALENSIISLTGPGRDAGLESLISFLKGLMPESKRKVAVAYESLNIAQTGLFTVNKGAAMEALASLYDMNAAKIIDAINEGRLDDFRTNPEVQKLINWAKASVAEGQKANPVATVQGDVKISMTPVLNVASAGEDMLVAIDGKCFLQTKRGSLTYVPNVAEMSEVPTEIRTLLFCMSCMYANPDEPNMLMFKPEIIDQLHKVLPVDSFGIDLLGGANGLVRIGDNAMSSEKALALINAESNDILAELMLNDTAEKTIKIVATTIRLFDKYRGVIYGNVYASKFEAKSTTFYMIVRDNGVATVTLIDGNVANTELCNNVFDVLNTEFVVANPMLHAAISNIFNTTLKEEAKSMSVHKRLLEQLSDERTKYEQLLNRIETELSDLGNVVDVNPDKEKALKELKTKTEGQIAQVSEAIDKLASK